MRIEIEIPKEFESDYNGDMFKDFFSRVLCDIKNGTMCGNYEKETAEMFLKAFEESKPAYDPDAVGVEDGRKGSVKMSKNEELKKAAEPLVKYLRENYHPHTTVIVDSMHAEVLEGVAVAKYEWKGEYGEL